MRFHFAAAKPEYISKQNGPPSPKSGEFLILQRIADKLRPISQASLTKGLKVFRGRINLRDLEKAVEEGRFDDAEKMVPFDDLQGDLKELEQIHRKGVVESGKASAPFFSRSVRRLIPTLVPTKFAFNAENPAISSFIKTRSASLVTNIDFETRKGIRQVIRQSVSQGLPPREISKIIPKTIGLNEKQALALANYRNKLEAVKASGTGVSQLTTNQRKIIAPRLGAKSLADPDRRGKFIARLDAQSVDRLTDKYSDRLLKERAENIARTELQLAVNQGQLEVWDQGADQGLFNRDTAQKQWVVTADERLDCAICEPMEGVKVGLNEQFSVPVVGGMDRPPAHPRCRCHVTIVFGEETE